MQPSCRPCRPAGMAPHDRSCWRSILYFGAGVAARFAITLLDGAPASISPAPPPSYIMMYVRDKYYVSRMYVHDVCTLADTPKQTYDCTSVVVCEKEGLDTKRRSKFGPRQQWMCSKLTMHLSSAQDDTPQLGLILNST